MEESTENWRCNGRRRAQTRLWRLGKFDLVDLDSVELLREHDGGSIDEVMERYDCMEIPELRASGCCGTGSGDTQPSCRNMTALANACRCDMDLRASD